jgi:hypothetical protein
LKQLLPRRGRGQEHYGQHPKARQQHGQNDFSSHYFSQETAFRRLALSFFFPAPHRLQSALAHPRTIRGTPFPGEGWPGGTSKDLRLMLALCRANMAESIRGVNSKLPGKPGPKAEGRSSKYAFAWHNSLLTPSS